MKKLITLFSAILALSASAQIPTTGLVAGYSFSGNANDESPNGNNGTVNGATLTTGRDGTPNSAYYFNGTSNDIRVPNSSSLTVSNVTMCAVVKPMGFYSAHCQSSAVIFKGDDQGSGSYDLVITDNVYDNNNCNTYDPAHQTFLAGIGNNLSATSSQELYTPYTSLNSWYCVVATWDGQNMKLYIDGVLKYTIPAANPMGSNSYSLSIGSTYSSPLFSSYPYWFNGVIDDIRIYNRALTPIEIQGYYTTTAGLTYDHYLHGTLYNDSTGDCQMQASEQRLPYYTITANPGNYYTVADDTGYYSLGINNSAIYTFSPVIPQYLAPLINNSCPANYSADINSSVSVDTGSFNFGFHVADCALLRIDVTGDRKRRCFRNTTTVFYTNDGVASADSVTIYVHFDQYDIPLSASLPYTLDATTNTLMFTIGALTAGQNGTITIIDSVACIPGITGLTQCTQAWILPPNDCLNDSTTGSGWDHSSVSVSGSCVNDTVRFVIYNDGTGNMTAPSQYRIYENNVLVYTGSFQLNSGDSLVIMWVSNGATVRLEADQLTGHPGNSHPRVTIEACGTDGSGNHTIGQVNLAPQDDADPDIEIDCQEIRDSYDPNEKSNSPEGISSAHTILPATPVDYIIHFQNTATATAYRVVVIDTLSNDFDISTLETGASSHPYTFSMYGQGSPVLKFTFNNINLPDSNANEAASHGFVKYKIAPKSSVVTGTQINNAADIYFDFNSPVRTNNAFVTLGNYSTVAVPSVHNTSSLVKAYPNPVSDNLSVEGNNIQQIKVITADGRIVLQEGISDVKQKVELSLNGLAQGIYILDCTSSGITERIRIVKY